MSLNPSALMTILIGSGIGGYIWLRYKRCILHVLYMVRLTTDEVFTTRHYQTLASSAFYDLSRYRVDVLPYEAHAQLIFRAQPHIQRSLHDELRATIRVLSIRLLKIGGAPLIVASIFGQGLTLACAMVVAVCLAVLMHFGLSEQREARKHMYTNILLRHAYTTAGYLEGFTRRPRVTPQPQHTTLITQPAHGSMLASTSHAAGIDLPNIAVPQRAMHQRIVHRVMHASWEEIWWLNDAIFSLLICLLYWFTNARTIGDYLAGTLQIILCVQLFFIVVWVVVKLTLRAVGQPSDNSLGKSLLR